jgi:hypothetical protein
MVAQAAYLLAAQGEDPGVPLSVNVDGQPAAAGAR